MKWLGIKTSKIRNRGKNFCINKLKYTQEYKDGGILILDVSNEEELNDPRIQALFKRSRHHTLPIFLINLDYYE